ncbi:hypothetical protein [Endozoicomonas euniceicola]|uniref:Peptidase C58 YopT-type domain-containing protein n=1 Tax=Endozoicomonas euniceicola TaxID=1234143 RepID=A0ABY6GXK7_9GAMM|nr:hypothetical protein [Endozoicomonas euniceicola]UYM17523.1 hypothetical protein NX720_06295 [Endozoicomonas euniceicola]
MKNIHSTSVTWRRTKIGENTRMIAISKLSNVGICTGMVLTWLKKSIASRGRGILRETELGSQHWMAIIQGAYGKRTIPGSNVLSPVELVISLLFSQNLKPCDWLKGAGFYPPEQLVSWALSKPGYSLFCFSFPCADGHMIGMRCEGRVLQMFNPTEGLYQYSNVSSFKQHMRQFLIKEDPKRFKEWDIFSVVSSL